MSKKEYTNTGSGLGYHASEDIYVDNEKVGSLVHRTDLSGKEYTETLDKYGSKIKKEYD